MKNVIRKIIAAFLLLTSCLPVLFTLFFLLKQQGIRHKMKENLEKEFMHTISVPKNEITWVKYNKEIKVEDKLFDIKSFSEKNGSYIFLGLFDVEETSLNNMLEKDTDDKNENELLFQLFQCLQSPCTSLSFDSYIITDHNKISYFPILLYIPSPFRNIPTPPPQA